MTTTYTRIGGQTYDSSVEKPAKRTFRDAWEFDGEAIVVNMNRARNLHKEALRRARAPYLQSLDVAYQRADEQGDTAEKTRVAKLKQRFRDVTDDQRIAQAETPEELEKLSLDKLVPEVKEV